MIQQLQLILPEMPRGFHLITDKVETFVHPLPEKGLLNLFLQHTSAGLCINENADPSVRTDLEYYFDWLVKENNPHFTHIYEGTDDMPAHIKSVLTGNSLSIPIHNSRLALGTWQGIYLGEFRNKGGRRKIWITVIS